MVQLTPTLSEASQSPQHVPVSQRTCKAVKISCFYWPFYQFHREGGHGKASDVTRDFVSTFKCFAKGIVANDKCQTFLLGASRVI